MSALLRQSPVSCDTKISKLSGCLRIALSVSMIALSSRTFPVATRGTTASRNVLARGEIENDKIVIQQTVEKLPRVERYCHSKNRGTYEAQIESSVGKRRQYAESPRGAIKVSSARDGIDEAAVTRCDAAPVRTVIPRRSTYP